MKEIMTKFLSATIMLVPRPVRRWLGERPAIQAAVQFLLRRPVVRTAPRGTKVVLHPVLHAPLIALPSLTDYEPEIWAVLSRLCHTGMIVYDVGANVGVFACHIADLVGPQGCVVAFEPEPHNYECLRETIRLNSLGHVHLEAIAVGEKKGLALFDRRGGAFSGRLRDHARYRVSKNLMQVQVTALDDYVYQDQHPAPEIVKIDVEGNELLVLKGMRRLLEDKPPTIVCELHSHLGDNPADVFTFLEEYGYRCFEPISIADGTPKPTRPTGERQHIVAMKQFQSKP